MRRPRVATVGWGVLEEDIVVDRLIKDIILMHNHNRVRRVVGD